MINEPKIVSGKCDIIFDATIVNGYGPNIFIFHIPDSIICIQSKGRRTKH